MGGQEVAQWLDTAVEARAGRVGSLPAGLGRVEQFHFLRRM